MKKIVLLIVILVLVGLAIWSTGDKTLNGETTANQIEQILNDAKTVTELDFSEITAKEFGWLEDSATTTKTISTKEIKVSNITTEDESNIEKFLTLKGFTLNELNSSTSTDPAFKAYSKDNVACVIISSTPIKEESDNNEATTTEEDMTLENGKNIILSCGFIIEPQEEEAQAEMSDSEGEEMEQVATTTDDVVNEEMNENGAPELE